MEEQTMSQADKEAHVNYTSSDGLWSAAEKDREESFACPTLKYTPFFGSKTDELSAAISPLLNAANGSCRFYS